MNIKVTDLINKYRYFDSDEEAINCECETCRYNNLRFLGRIIEFIKTIGCRIKYKITRIIRFLFVHPTQEETEEIGNIVFFYKPSKDSSDIIFTDYKKFKKAIKYNLKCIKARRKCGNIAWPSIIGSKKLDNTKDEYKEKRIK